MDRIVAAALEICLTANGNRFQHCCIELRIFFATASNEGKIAARSASSIPGKEIPANTRDGQPEGLSFCEGVQIRSGITFCWPRKRVARRHFGTRGMFLSIHFLIRGWSFNFPARW